MLWNGSKEDGDVRSGYEEDEGTVEMETGTLIGKGTWNLTCFSYKCMKLRTEYFFLSFLWDHVRFG